MRKALTKFILLSSFHFTFEHFEPLNQYFIINFHKKMTAILVSLKFLKNPEG